jgi:CRISPR-associated exonuclease Cas4
MIFKYKEDDFLSLSGIQHYAYCPRQWALIHIEQQWKENLRTKEGRQLHERVDNPSFFESRGNILIARSVPIASYKLGLYGVSDIIEFHNNKKSGVTLPGRNGTWKPIPIEYKRGKPKENIFDDVQLCAQAICLEEMLGCKISHGYFYYGQIRHRHKVLLNKNLRDIVNDLSGQMHKLFDVNHTPETDRKLKNCRNCSLFDICVPKLKKKKFKIESYINQFIEE